METTKDTARHYVSNKEFTADIIAYKAECEALEAEGKEVNVIPTNIARQLIAIANKLGSRYNFVNYTFKDEMVASAIYACCAKIRKFDGDVSQNAFAYFTNVCWRAMVDVINHEEEMSYIKAKAFQSMDFSDALDADDISEFEEHSGTVNDFITYFDTDAYEKKLKDAKDRQKKTVKKTTSTQLDM